VRGLLFLINFYFLDFLLFINFFTFWQFINFKFLLFKFTYFNFNYFYNSQQNFKLFKITSFIYIFKFIYLFFGYNKY